MNASQLAQVARALVAGSKGLLAMDENDGERATGGSRRAGGPQTGEARRACRELITFLSGGQSGELASSRLNAMNLLVGSAKSRLPRALTFSLARAIQHPALDIWNGRDANVAAAQQALLHRAQCNRAALRGEYSAAMEQT